MHISEIFSNRVKIAPKMGIKQSDLGESIGLSDRAVSDIERGYRLTTMEKLYALAEFFDVSIDYLMGRTNNPKSHR